MRQHSIIILIIFAIIILIIFAILLINCNNNRDKKYYFVKENINVELESPIKITKIAEEEYFFDFGKDAFGSLVVLLNKKINSKALKSVFFKFLTIIALLLRKKRSRLFVGDFVWSLKRGFLSRKARKSLKSRWMPGMSRSPF